MEPSGVGTRVAKPSSLPLSSGSTSETARAAPVVVGIMDKRGSAGATQVLVRQVEDLLVVGVGVDRVHEAALDAEVVQQHLREGSKAVRGAGGVRDDVVLVSGLYWSSFTPMTMVMSSFLAGAEMTTFLAPASRCALRLGSRR